MPEQVLLRMRLRKLDQKVIKRFGRAIERIGELIEDLPWKQDDVRKIQMDLEYVAKHLKVEKDE